MRRNQHIGRIPQRIVGRQRLRVRDVERCAGDLGGLERSDERRLVDDGAARDVGNVGAGGVGGVEQGELRRREEVGCLLAVGLLGLGPGVKREGGEDRGAGMGEG